MALPKGITPKQTAILYLLSPGSVVAYHQPTNPKLREAIQVLEFYCGVPELGRAWRGVIDFKQPGAPGMPNWMSPGLPGYGLGAAFSQPNEIKLRESVVALLEALFIQADAPFYAYRPVQFRAAFAESLGLDLRDIVECWRIVERDFGLLPVPYDVKPRRR